MFCVRNNVFFKRENNYSSLLKCHYLFFHFAGWKHNIDIIMFVVAKFYNYMYFANLCPEISHVNV